MTRVATRCPKCGTHVANRQLAEGLCPGCLLTAGATPGHEPPYEILAPIGSDTGGVTYLAETTVGRSRHVALKIVGPRDDWAAILSRFERWRPALDLIEHPTIRRLLDAGPVAPSSVYLASEYIAGAGLEQVLGNSPPRVDRAAIARQIAEGVAAAHRAGVVHGRLDVAHVKVLAAPRLAVKILGFATSAVVDGIEARLDDDVQAVLRLMQDLEIDLGLEEWRSAADILRAIG